MSRLPFILLPLVFFYCCAVGQPSRYSDREIYTGTGKRLPLIAAPAGQVHLWSFERYQTRVHEFDSELRFLQSRVIKIPIKAGFRFEFLRFNSFYYTVMSDSSSSGIYQVEPDGSIKDQTKQVLSNLSLPELRPYYFTKSRSHIFLVQKNNDESAGQTVINIHVFDSSFNYQSKMALNVPYVFSKAQNIELTVIGEDIFLLGQMRNSEGIMTFSITKIDAINQVLATKAFHPENLDFVEHKIFEMNGGLVLESQVREHVSGKLPETFTYLMKMDHELRVTHTLFLTAEEVDQMNTGAYYFRPAVTVGLPDKKLLNISYGRKKDPKDEVDAELYRFVAIDSNFHITNSFVQRTERGKFTPTLTLIIEKTIHFFYEEYVRNHVSMIRKVEIKNSKLEDGPVLLDLNFEYDLTRAVATGSSFVMPYYRRGNVGLVRVRM